jgi:hypothetical protein
VRYQQADALPSPNPLPTENDETNPQILQLSHPVLAPPEQSEAEARDLVGGEDLVLEQVEQDLMVSLVDRARARA